MDAIQAEEVARGWTVQPLLGQRAQHQEGCDFFSIPPRGGPPHPIEVKGWGESLIKRGERFNYPADMNAEQYHRACLDPNFRLEIVANLTAAREGRGNIERLTLTAEEIVARAVPSQYRLPLEGLVDRIRRG